MVDVPKMDAFDDGQKVSTKIGQPWLITIQINRINEYMSMHHYGFVNAVDCLESNLWAYIDAEYNSEYETAAQKLEKETKKKARDYRGKMSETSAEELEYLKAKIKFKLLQQLMRRTGFTPIEEMIFDDKKQKPKPKV